MFHFSAQDFSSCCNQLLGTKGLDCTPRVELLCFPDKECLGRCRPPAWPPHSDYQSRTGLQGSSFPV